MAPVYMVIHLDRLIENTICLGALLWQPIRGAFPRSVCGWTNRHIAWIARHGSTRWLWKPENVTAAIRYVVDQQGDSMAVFEAGAP
jgi:hypothetical protein